MSELKPCLICGTVPKIKQHQEYTTARVWLKCCHGLHFYRDFTGDYGEPGKELMYQESVLLANEWNTCMKSTVKAERDRGLMSEKNIISWFSCGAASAVATKLALNEYPDLTIIYQETNSEHSDNKRFLRECEDWFGKEIVIQKSDKYHDIWDVFESRKYLVGVKGAPCTGELKRKLAEDYLFSVAGFGSIEVFGYTVEEKLRVERFKENNDERNIYPILVERSLTKDDCLGILHKAGIKLPTMYELGYRNNNCIGCVKGGMGYWNKIRKDFPKVFARMSKLERKLGHSILRRQEGGVVANVYLDDLDPDAGDIMHDSPVQCGLLCQIEFENIQQ